MSLSNFSQTSPSLKQPWLHKKWFNNLGLLKNERSRLFSQHLNLAPIQEECSLLHTTVTAGVTKSSGGIQEVFLPPPPFHAVVTSMQLSLHMKVTPSVEKSSHQVVLNSRSLNWGSSALTTRPLHNVSTKTEDFCSISYFPGFLSLKGYLHYITITSQNVPPEAQVKIFFVLPNL